MTKSNSKKKIVMLATIHQYQTPGDPGNEKLEACVVYLSQIFEVQKVLEEWTVSNVIDQEEQKKSYAEALAAKLGLEYANVGTPCERPFRTCCLPAIHPGVPPPFSAEAPDCLLLYTPFEAQEAREMQMALNILRAMEKKACGLFIFGMAHTHSLHAKLVACGYEVTSCILG